MFFLKKIKLTTLHEKYFGRAAFSAHRDGLLNEKRPCHVGKLFSLLEALLIQC